MNRQPEHNPNRPTPPPYNPGGGGQPRPPYPGYPPQQPPQWNQPQWDQPQWNQPRWGAPGYGQPQWGQQPWQPYPQRESRSNGMGTAGFVLSLVSIFIGWVPFIGWLIWILASVFSFIGLFNRPRGLAIAGVIISLVVIPMIVTLLVAIDAFTSAMFLM